MRGARAPGSSNGLQPRQVGLLALVLVVAAALRLGGLAWGLRHAPDQDERPFVENAVRLAREEAGL